MKSAVSNPGLESEGVRFEMLVMSFLSHGQMQSLDPVSFSVWFITQPCKPGAARAHVEHLVKPLRCTDVRTEPRRVEPTPVMAAGRDSTPVRWSTTLHSCMDSAVSNETGLMILEADGSSRPLNIDKVQ